MLKKLILCSGLAVLCGVSAGALYAQPATNNTTTVDQKTLQFCLYPKQDLKSTCKKQPLTMRFVTILSKDGWAKVGLHDHDGTVGWLHLADYHHKLQQWMQPNIQTVYINVTEDKSGKPSYNIVAYKNGKPVSAKEAQHLYQQLRQQQQQQMRGWSRWSADMNRMMNADLLGMRRLMHDAFPHFNLPFHSLPEVKNKPEGHKT